MISPKSIEYSAFANTYAAKQWCKYNEFIPIIEEKYCKADFKRESQKTDDFTELIKRHIRL